MTTVPEISSDEAATLLESGEAVFVDVRDIGSWRAGHIPGALHLGDHNIRRFVDEGDKGRTTVVYCYHGNSSIGGAGYLLSEGFADVSSMRGGFADWQGRPTETAPMEPTSAPPPRPRATVPPPPAPSPRESRRRKWIRRIRSLSRSKG